MKTKLFPSVGLAVLLVLVTLTGVAQAAHSNVDPVGYCETATVEAVTAGTYDLSASGWGQWAQVVDIATGEVIIRTDFGQGAIAFNWADLPLTQGVQYQVQVSRYEETGYGGSPANCLFVPPVPQGIVIARFEFINYAFEWDSLEDGLGYWIINGGGRVVVPWVQAQSPGNVGYFQYSVSPPARVKPGLYILIAQDTSGIYEVARVTIP